LLRMSPELHQEVAQLASSYGQSLNEFLIQTIEERVEKEMQMNVSFSRIVIDELKVKEVREAVIVTQHPWFMQLLHKYHVYFFNPSLGRVTPMQYLLFYETTKQESDGTKNEHPRHIAHYGKVKEIIYDIQPSDYIHVPELQPLMNDPAFWDEIRTWGITNVVLLSELGTFTNPLPLQNGLEARYLVNKTTTLPLVRNAKYIDEL
ncbi:toxin-antitoxin system HicB family antitoxin, partial [Anoxybacteroides voinovskiense]|uniref:toxin-antitoxin system HicB family antitoxin n=1 Tax=Anoxybacteroides voinovskiense TaxID=230470 RepID=UPI00166E0658